MVSLIENPGIIRGRDLPGGPTLGALIAETDFEATNAIEVKCVPTNSENRRRLPKRRRRRWQAGRCALDNGHLRTESGRIMMVDRGNPLGVAATGRERLNEKVGTLV